jgi:hypothetical protein
MMTGRRWWGVRVGGGMGVILLKKKPAVRGRKSRRNE